MNNAIDSGGGGGLPLHATETLYVETQALYNAAYAWGTEIFINVAGAQAQVSAGQGQGYLFGVSLGALWDPHDLFAKTMSKMLSAAIGQTGVIGDALQQAAKDYEASDEHVAGMMNDKDKVVRGL